MAKSNALSAKSTLALAKNLPRSVSLDGVPGILLPRPKTLRVKLDLTGCARTGLEKAIARSMAFAPPEPLLRERNPDRQRLLFRAYYVPTIAAALIGASRGLDAKSKKWEPPWWLIDHAVHLVAFERMFLEEGLCSESSSRRAAVSLRRTDTIEDLPQPTSDCFPHDSDQIRHLEARLEEWRHYSWRSVKLYFGIIAHRKIAKLPEPQVFGALMGAVQKLTPLPAEALPPLVSQLQKSGRDTEQWFRRVASEIAPDNRRNNYELDTWLIEVHPLTLRLNWRHHNLFSLVPSKFKKEGLTEEKLRNRMRDLRLRLSAKASRAGKPSKAQITTGYRLNQAESLAHFIRSVGEDDKRWMLGRLGLTTLRT